MKKKLTFREESFFSLRILFIKLKIVILIIGISGSSLLANDTYMPFVGMPDEEVQQMTVSGRVTDSNTGEAMPGVNILVRGTTIGAITDVNGRYAVSGVTSSATLLFSFIGYVSQEIQVSGRTTVDVALVAEVLGLDEVVVVGYGTRVRSTITGSISQVNAADVQTFSGSTNVVDALQASVSGALVIANSGRPGETSNIYLRGPVSVRGGNPLYVVDGIPRPDLGYNFNLDDVESISVLKDASAAAIYGAQAAGGVILVTTKRGTQSKIQVSSSASYGLRQVYAIPKQLRRDDYIAAKALAGHDVVDLYGPESGWKNLPDTDWMNEVFRLGSEQNYGISLRGGSEGSTFYLSGNYNRVLGVGIGNWIQRYTLRLNSDHQVLPKLKFSPGVYFKAGLENPSGGGMNQSFRRTPVMAVYDPEAVTNNGYARVVRGFQGNNTVQNLLGNYQRNKDWAIDVNGTLTYSIIKGLNASVFGGASMAFGDLYSYVYKVDDGARVDPATITKGSSYNMNYIVTYTLNFNRTFGNHNVSALAGYEARQNKRAALQYDNLETLVPAPQSSSLVVSALNATGSFSQADVFDRILSQFGRLEYTYANKYLVTANIRRDGYGSKFGPAYKYGVFPGISTGWVLSQESFMKDIKIINLLKLRAGYGLLGNAVGDDFAYTSFYTVGFSQDWSETDVNTKQSGIGLASQLANAEIRWESVATTNIGLDGTMFNSRLSFNIDYYSRQTKEMLYNVPISLSAGVGTNVQANIGQMSNKGVEAFVGYRTIVGAFNIDLGLNIGHNKNKLISLNPEIEKLYIASGYIAGESGAGMYGDIQPNRSEPGLPLGLFYGYQSAGIYQANVGPGETRPTVRNFVPEAGDLIYIDQNDDGKIDDLDKVYIGNPWPKATIGITIGGGWKNIIDVKAIFSGTLGNDIYNAYESYSHNFFSDYTTTMDIYKCSFFGDNGLTDVPRTVTVQRPDRNGNWGLLSDYHVEDGSYIMLRNLQIGFTMPKRMASLLRVSRLKAVLTGENLFTLTKYTGLTPVVAPYQRSILNQGVDRPSGRYPYSRLYSIGVNIEF